MVFVNIHFGKMQQKVWYEIMAEDGEVFFVRKMGDEIEVENQNKNAATISVAFPLQEIYVIPSFQSITLDELVLTRFVDIYRTILELREKNNIPEGVNRSIRIVVS
ncbi:hypothetical protein [Halobacillus litoralis]|nr:hypothetical protein [Halobacillus litoralis]